MEFKPFFITSLDPAPKFDIWERKENAPQPNQPRVRRQNLSKVVRQVKKIFKRKKINKPAIAHNDLHVETPTNKTPNNKVKMSTAVATLFAAIFLSGILSLVFGNSSFIADKRFAYIELKALSPALSAVPGAKVIVNGEELGTTDSFGEWRRFIRVGLGTQLAIEITKNSVHPALTAQKNIIIPKKVDENEELEINTSIQLISVKEKIAQNNQKPNKTL